MHDRVLVKVGGRELELSNLDKVLYPAAGFTKGEIIDYYTRIAPVLLPHLENRALTRIRYPNGVDSKGFFEKNAPGGTPDWVRQETLPAPGSTKNREMLDYIVADDLPTLVWLANLAALELHTPQWRSAPTARTCSWSIWTRGRPPGSASAAGSPCSCATGWPTTASRVPEDVRQEGHAAGLPDRRGTAGRRGSGYAHRVADELARAEPKLIVSKMAKQLRGGKVFIDWSQNNAAKTTVTPYSLRAQPTPSVSTPLTWDEVASGEVVPAELTPAVALERVDRYGDLLGGLLDGGPRVPAT